MNCYLHPEVEAVAFCRICGRPLCPDCRRDAAGTVFCAGHLPEQQPLPAPPPASAQPVGASPGLAFALGLIPGVGAIYNGQYTKGLVHVVVFGTLVSVLSSGLAHPLEPLFGLLLTAWCFYMAFEAYHTAARRRRGLPVDEFSGLFPAHSSSSAGLAGPIVLIVLGVIFLIMTVWPQWLWEVFRFWPVLLIAAGIYMLLERLRERDTRKENSRSGEAHDEPA